ncbi:MULTISPECIES: FkbM family methyltransferase [unclassified Massilia]|uniref:FkbM family methyltransferase n=1 Tax=unclassified Massilia TaxID=2609279 RepID=UPI00177E855C|nr:MULTISPECIES: FkbM family methyltransferase [unclassified Massilia]MBD8529898.1 FkbM family methyltransferase [Massilia sp. CFBP 13647]MBD8672090.1 FkbM family methyltransferase [Massilia sp. CFBP 13721]
MGFLSYAQNFEDVMLWRALGHIPNGTYVDVGAQHPRIDSISRAFYEHGWRGIHVEPVPAFADMLRQDRPDEIVLQVALGATEGTLELNIFADTGLSTAIAAYAERHQSERGYEVQRMHVPVLTLKSALSALVDKDVHWLKIDVEGFEEQVLRGWDSTQLRPWVLVVEATIPNSPATDYAGWDPLVTAAGYRFVYFDGLNRFYIADEHPELAAAFAVPPNIFDTVELSGLASWGLCNVAVANERARADQATAQLRACEDELHAAHAAAAAQQEAAAAQQEAAQAECARLSARLAELGRETLLLHEQVAHGALARTRIGALEAEAREREATVSELEAAVREREQLYGGMRAERDAANLEVAEQRHKAEHWWRSAEALREELALVYRSRSWRVSAPLRQAGLRARQSRTFSARVLRWTLRQVARLRGRLGSRGASGAGSQASQATQHGAMVVLRQGGAPALSRRLSRNAARLYEDLKNAVDEGKT